MKSPRTFAARGGGPSPGTRRRALLRNLEETREALELAHAGFDQTGDPDLLEFYLFEISALRARHTYLLRCLKALEEPGTPEAGDQRSSLPEP